MKGWSKLEEKLNHLIESLVTLISQLVSKLTPARIKNLLKPKPRRDSEKLKKLKEKALALKSKATQKAKKAKAVASSQLDKAKKVDVKKIKWRHVLAGMAAFILPVLDKIKIWYFSLQPKTIALVIAGGTTISLASLNIYVQSKKIAQTDKSAEQAELVAELEKANALSRRPANFRKEEKQFKIEGVALPAYFSKDAKSMKKLEIDFTVQASNKYIRAYFNEHHYLVRDALNSKTNPITIDFPLEEEGKGVVRDKVKKELKALLKKLKIEGEIQEVHIHSIFGG